MKTEESRSHILPRKFAPWFSFLILIVLAATLSIVTAFAQGTSPNSQDEFRPEDLILRHVKYPSADVIDLLPFQDSYITSNRPDQNYGQSQELWLGYDQTRTGGGVQRAYLHWDTSVIPDMAIVNSAEVWFNVSDVNPDSDGAMNVDLRHLAGAWLEGTLTWNNAPSPDTGGLLVSSSIPGSTSWKVLGVTALVKEWVNGAHGNNGLIIQGFEGAQHRERSMYTANASSNNNRPFLRVNYTESTDSQAPTAAMVPFPQPVIATEQFQVSWTGSDTGGSGLDYFDVQYDAEGDGQGWLNWKLHTPDTSAQFSGESTKYLFRVRAADRAGNLSPWSAAEEVTVDAAPPVVKVLPIVPSVIQTNSFLVEWSGDDGPNGTGIQSFDVYARQGSGSWTLWKSATVDTSATYTASVEAAYTFEAIGTDNIGNVEPLTGMPESGVYVDLNPPFVGPIAYLPQVFKN